MRFLYLNTANIYPQDTHFVSGLRELGYEVQEILDQNNSNSIARLKEIFKDGDQIIVGYPSPLLALRLKIRTGKAIIFNAVSSQYEANVISRKEYGFLFHKCIKSWLLDFLSFHLSSKVLLESRAQVEFIHKVFLVPRKKLFVSYSGLNEKEFFYDPSVAKRKKFAVLFRGRFLPESGILTVIKSAKLLENSEVDFLIIGHGFMYREVNALMKKLSPKNISMVHDRISIQELRNQMLSCHVSLGQVAIHKRLERTIPCKLFESIALKLPYITGENIGALEILSNNETCLTVEPGNEKDLADKILYLKNNPDKSLRIAEAGYKLYIEKLTSKELVRSTLTALGY